MFSEVFNNQTDKAHLGQALLIIAGTVLLLVVLNQLVALVSPRLLTRVDSLATGRNVLRWRRAETNFGLILTAVRVLVALAAALTIWHIYNPSSGPVALIGVGTGLVLLGGATIVPLLRDVTYGFIMMAEQWYGVGDHVVFEPNSGTNGGVVERITLRSTKLRSINGEAIWMHHQYVQGVHVTSAASHPLIVETFVNDPDKGRRIVEDAIDIMPTGPTTIPQPLQITEIKQIKPRVWRITAVCEVTPFREWMIDNFAVDVIRKTDQLTGEPPVILYGPINYYADPTAEKRFKRAAKARQRLKVEPQPLMLRKLKRAGK